MYEIKDIKQYDDKFRVVLTVRPFFIYRLFGFKVRDYTFVGNIGDWRSFIGEEAVSRGMSQTLDRKVKRLYCVPDVG